MRRDHPRFAVLPMRAACLLFAVAAGMICAPARAANPLELNFYLSGPRYSGELPGCPAALGDIQSRFSQKESRFWNSSLQIVGFDTIHETAYRPWAANTIPRRFCSGRALTSDGTWHKVHYVIGEDTGQIGITWGVDFCVVGLDRNSAYNPACRMAQP